MRECPNRFICQGNNQLTQFFADLPKTEVFSQKLQVYMIGVPGLSGPDDNQSVASTLYAKNAGHVSEVVNAPA